MVEHSVKKQEILKAASDCFAHYGYEKTTLDDIGDRVGLNKASLYYYYKNKEAIFSEVIFLEATEFVKVLKSKVAQVTGCKEQVLLYLVERLRYIHDVMNLRNLSLETVKKFRPLFEKLSRDINTAEVDFLNGLLENYRIKKQLIDCDTRRIAASVLTISDAIKGKYMQSSGSCILSDDDYRLIEDEVQYTVALVLDGILQK